MTRQLKGKSAGEQVKFSYRVPLTCLIGDVQQELGNQPGVLGHTQSAPLPSTALPPTSYVTSLGLSFSICEMVQEQLLQGLW